MQYNAIDVVKAWAYRNLGLDSNNKFIGVHVNRSSYVVSNNTREDRPDDNDGDMYFLSYIYYNVDVSIFLATNGDVIVARDRVDEEGDPSILIGSIDDIIDGKPLSPASHILKDHHDLITDKDYHDPRTDSEITRQ
jgi:hypothetical protein